MTGGQRGHRLTGPPSFGGPQGAPGAPDGAPARAPKGALEGTCWGPDGASEGAFQEPYRLQWSEEVPRGLREALGWPLGYRALGSPRRARGAPGAACQNK